MLKTLNRRPGQPLYLQIHQQIRDLIRVGDLSTGTRLPSERELALLLGVNRTTVSKAYQELFADGLIERQVGRGTVVCPILDEEDVYPLPWSDYFATIGRQSQDPLQELFISPDQDFIPLSYGVPDPDLRPIERFAEAADRILRRHGASAFEFSPVEAFKEILAQWMIEQGGRATPDNILPLTGAQQGLDLLARAFITPGDSVVVEKPTYINAVGTFREAGARFIEIPVDEDGMRIDILERVLRQHRPRLIYTMPTFQNPSGFVMSLERRQALIALAQRYQIPIIEENPYSQFYDEVPPPPSLKSLDRGGHVIYLSTFSNTVFPGMRLGWMVAPQPVIRRLETIKQFVDMYSSTFFQWIMVEFIQQGWLIEHLDKVRPIYTQRRRAMLDALEQYIDEGLQWHKPTGGFFIWCHLEDHFRAKDFLIEAKQQHLFFVIGEPFHANHSGQETFRLSFAYHNEMVIQEGIRRLGEALRIFRA
ncbi:MAG: PLP-dependent aminotransferase family protein [Chloroflexota bacterium]